MNSVQELEADGAQGLEMNGRKEVEVELDGV
jgi:hypothetical protein